MKPMSKELNKAMEKTVKQWELMLDEVIKTGDCGKRKNYIKSGGIGSSVNYCHICDYSKSKLVAARYKSVGNYCELCPLRNKWKSSHGDYHYYCWDEGTLYSEWDDAYHLGDDDVCVERLAELTKAMIDSFNEFIDED